MKALIPIKAKPLDDDELTAWFEGRVPRRLLAIPFGGPIPSAKSKLGVDIDGEWFSPRTDIYGTYSQLRSTRDRLVDFHHGLDPTGMMGNTIIGKSILDPDPDEDGWWVDVWLKAGEKRLSLIKRLVERGAQLFGSSQAAYKKADPDTGEILEWPFYIETLSTSPQNTYSVLRPAMKAALDSADLDVSEALRDFIRQVDNLGTDLPATLARDGVSGERAAKAGRVSLADVQALRDAIGELGAGASAWSSRFPEPPTEGDAS
jgi:hypothetical protein